MAQQILNNQWQKILSSGTYDGETYTADDLDKIAAEYGTRQEGDKAPVGLGTPAEGHPEVLGKIDALRRVGSSLEGKFSNIDPRVDHLYGRGALPKTSVQIKRSAEGDTLQRVGLISPTWHGPSRSWRDDKTPALDELMKQHVGTKDHIFKEGQMNGSNRGGVTDKYAVFTGSFDVSESRADAEIARLKAHGYWSERFDRFGFPALFSEVPHLVGHLSKFVRCLRDNDPTTAVLSECAQYWASSHGVSFSEGLSQVTKAPSQWFDTPNIPQNPEDKQRQRDADLESSKRALTGGVITRQIYDLAWKYANAGGLTFKQAMVQVRGEHPEWFSALAQKQLDSGWGSGA